jgi:hypothetical protein
MTCPINRKFSIRLASLFSVAALSVLISTPVQAQPVDAETGSPTSTSANDLQPVSQSLDEPTEAQGVPIAQQITPGRATRSGPSYIGIGGNIGFGGDTALGEGSFVVFSKVGLTPNFSLRPGVAINDDPTVLVPVTVDFPIDPISEAVPFDVAPYVGGGVAISTGSDSLVRPLVTGGLDVPLSEQFTANANVNVAFFRDTEVGLILGVGYNF